MNKLLSQFVLAALIISMPIVSFAQFTDDFTDGDFTVNPTWTGNTSHFLVNPAFELQLNAPSVIATSHLVTPSQAIGNSQFDFKVKMGFDPSTSNYAKVYLVSTDSNLSGSLNGYYVRIGGASGTIDDVSLFYQNGITTTKIINGRNGTVAISPNLNVRVTRDMAGNWELLTDTNLSGTYISEGTFFHNQTTTSAYFGVKCIYTSTRSDKFFFDNFVVTGGPVMDIDPPMLDSVLAITLNQIDVYFNEKVDLTTSEIASNYSVNNSQGSPINVRRDITDSTLVHLEYGVALPNYASYILTVTNVEDLTGNAITSIDTTFTTNFTFPYAPMSVVINEVFPDPKPVIGLPEAEFVELRNNTNSSINLNNWVYGDASSKVSLPSYELLAQNYVILCHEDDTTHFKSYGKVIGLSKWPTLNNSGDNLGLRDALNTLIDSVNYDLTWYNDVTKADGGWTLERKNPQAPCSDKNNWTASNNISGGTPGTQNSVFTNVPDNSTPAITSFAILSSSEIELSFNKAIDSQNVNTSDFSINNGLTVTSAVSVELTKIKITVNPNMLTTKIYELSVKNLADCYGNAMADTTFNIAIGRTPTAFDLIFTEIFASPDPANINLPEAEFVEIYNTTSEPITLSGSAFSDRSTSVNLPNEVLFPGEYAILTEDIVANKFERFGRVIALSSWPSLNNSGDLISLTGPTGTIDAVLYSDTWYNDTDKKAGGWSLELINTEISCLGFKNWTASNASDQASPGQENSVFDNSFTVEFNLVTASAISLNQIELVFSKLVNPSLVTASNFAFNQNVNVISATLSSDQFNVVILEVSPNLEVGVEYEVTALNMTDCAGDLLQNATAEISLPSSQDLLINEVLFNPNTGGSDFIELYNTTNKNIDLKNWSLLYYNNSGDSAYKIISVQSYIVQPGGFVVLSEDSSNIKFEYPTSEDSTFLEMDLPTYANAEGEVTVLNQMRLLNDQFNYNENMHFELINDFKGVTLERVNYILGANSAKNWHSASSTSGFGTPGFENSQYLEGQVAGNEITISPKTFSPNNDGYKDMTAISYNFNTSGYVATVTVHNDNGQLVKTLLNNQTIDANGELIWDGTNERSEILPTGMYIIMFRIFDLENNQLVYKNVAVLAMP
jgi:hypothetical protein